ncbi:MAG TPA: GTPase [Candidatus Deferrimicrobium sp.]|nr:GTPase [Candidatus Deferrimicrobium sp.]
MPANLPPQYYELEREFRAEKDPREKLRLAQELLAIMPKHKGTDKLQADMKAKIAKLKKELTASSAAHGVRHAPTHDHIEREGAGQIILIGPPNCGKSSLLAALTHAHPIVADYPYSTREPLTGMMTYETVHLQLIDTPPISPTLCENYLSGLIRNADIVVVVCDLSAPTMREDVRFVLQKLEEKRIILNPRIPQLPEDPRNCYKTTLICAHKADGEITDGSRSRLMSIFPGFIIVETSLLDDTSLTAFKKAIFDSLGIMRVYTKPVGKEADFTDPIILPIGSTVEAAATTLHKDFAYKLKFARVWGRGKFDGQRVQHHFQLCDGDIVEFHI